MDRSRFGLQQGWDNNSALEGSVAVHDTNFRDGGPYDDRRFADERYLQTDYYQRNSFNRDFVERENYPPTEIELWSQSRRRSYEDDYSIDRNSGRHEKQYMDSYHDLDSFQEDAKFRQGYYQDRGFTRHAKYEDRFHDDYDDEDFDYRSRNFRENSHERDYEYGRNNYDCGDGKSARKGGYRKRHGSYDDEREKRTLARERELSPHRHHEKSRSRSRSVELDDRSASRSPRRRSHSRSQREDSYDDYMYDRTEKRREREDRRQRCTQTAPSATIVVKGLSQKTTDQDLYQILAEWGPLRHVRVIKERSSGVSRGFAFVDFPSVDAASFMMEKIGQDGIIIDDKKVFFEYSSKPTGAAPGLYGLESSGKTGYYRHRNLAVQCDWICSICDCVNFARRTSCFQCNEPRTEDSLPAEANGSNMIPFSRKGFETGPTHVLVVRGLDENADEEMLRYEFSKHAVIKDLRLVRDKFTHVSRGFAFVHFHSVEDATNALEATNGTTLEKNGQVLRVQYAKSILGPGSTLSGPPHSSSLAAAAIEAAAFAQQYDTAGWVPKEYNSDEKSTNHTKDQTVSLQQTPHETRSPKSGFVWDEASGYYFDAASGFYYDGNSGLYYDGNNGIWYSYDSESQQYIPCTDNSDTKLEDQSEKQQEVCNNRKVVISAPPAANPSVETTPSLSEAVQAAANAALAAEKKEKDKPKEIKFASKTSILANKKKMNNVLSMWKQRSHEGQARGAVDDNQFPASIEEKTAPSKNKIKLDSSSVVDSSLNGRGGTLRGSVHTSSSTSGNPFRTDASALGSYSSSVSSGGRRRFSETPSSSQKETSQAPVYRDRAAERRSLYGSSVSILDDDRESSLKKNSDAMPFPPGVGGGRGGGDVANFEVIPADRALDETNVGNRMLRNMGWHEGSGLGKDGSGMIEPVQAQAIDHRAGLGSQKRKLDPSLEVQAGDTYKTLLQKKALARFREMS